MTSKDFSWPNGILSMKDSSLSRLENGDLNPGMRSRMSRRCWVLGTLSFARQKVKVVISAARQCGNGWEEADRSWDLRALVF